MNTPSTILYSDRNCHYCQRVRLVLHEKRIPFDLRFVDGELPPDILEDSAYGMIPTLRDRDLTVFFPHLILEYLEERYPHPPLMPEVPTERARIRIFMQQIEQEWGQAVNRLANPGYSRSHVLRNIRTELRQSVLTIAPIFDIKPYYMSETLTLLDCCAMSILWRLPTLGVDIPRTRQTRALLEYIGRMQETTSFKDSLTDVEKEIMNRKPWPALTSPDAADTDTG